MQSRKANISLEDAYKTVEVEEFLNISRLGRSKGYQYINSGVVKSILMDGKRLIFIQSWFDFLERLLAEQPTFTRARHPIRWPRPSDAEPAAAETRPSPRRRGRPPKLRPATAADAAAPSAMAVANNTD